MNRVTIGTCAVIMVVLVTNLAMVYVDGAHVSRNESTWPPGPPIYMSQGGIYQVGDPIIVYWDQRCSDPSAGGYSLGLEFTGPYPPPSVSGGCDFIDQGQYQLGYAEARDVGYQYVITATWTSSCTAPPGGGPICLWISQEQSQTSFEVIGSAQTCQYGGTYPNCKPPPTCQYGGTYPNCNPPPTCQYGGTYPNCNPPPTCPYGGTYPNCNLPPTCPYGGTYPNCNPPPSCPYGGTYPNCNPPLTCPYGGIYPNCNPAPSCPNGGTYPNCNPPPSCSNGGTYPNCNPPPTQTCQYGGTYPNCNQPPTCNIACAGVGGVITDLVSNGIAEATGLQAAGTAAASGAAGFFIPSAAGALASYGANQALSGVIPNDKERCIVSSAVGAVTGCATGAALGFIGFGVGAVVGCLAGSIGSLVIGTGLSCFAMPGTISSSGKRGKLLKSILYIHASDPRLYAYYIASMLAFWLLLHLFGGLTGLALVFALVASVTLLTLAVRTAFVARLNRRIGVKFSFDSLSTMRLGVILFLAVSATFLIALLLPPVISIVLIPITLIGISFSEPAILTDKLGFAAAIRKSAKVLASTFQDYAYLLSIFLLATVVLGSLSLNMPGISFLFLLVYAFLLVPIPSIGPHLLYHSVTPGTVVKSTQDWWKPGQGRGQGSQGTGSLPWYRLTNRTQSRQAPVTANARCNHCGNVMGANDKVCANCGKAQTWYSK